MDERGAVPGHSVLRLLRAARERWRRISRRRRLGTLTLVLGQAAWLASMRLSSDLGEASHGWRVWLLGGFAWLGGGVLTAIAVIMLSVSRDAFRDLATCRKMRWASYLALAIWFLMLLGLGAFTVRLGVALLRGSLPVELLVYPFAFFAPFWLIGIAICWSSYQEVRWTGRELRRLQNQCLRCGYPLKGLPEPRCPECGTPSRSDA